MICPNCNAQVPDGGFFCPECGMRMQQAAAAVVATAAMEVPVSDPVVPQPEAPVYGEPVIPQPEAPVYSEPVIPQPEAPSYIDPVFPQPEIPGYTHPVAVMPEEPAKPKKEKKVKEKKVKEKKVKEKKPASGKKVGMVILTVLLVLLLLASAGLNVWQYMTNEDTVAKLQDQIASLEATVADKEQVIAGLEADVTARDNTIDDLNNQVSSGNDTADSLNGEIADLNEKLQGLESDLMDRDAVIGEQADVINSLEPLAANYEAILTELSGYNLGYAADHFNADTGIIVMSMAEGTRQFYLTAHWPEGGTVTIEMSSYAADLDFDNYSWEDGTFMTVTAAQPGVCVTTFTNDIDDCVFKVLIIVTE